MTHYYSLPTGITWNGYSHVARITVAGKQRYLGSFEDALTAAAAVTMAKDLLATDFLSVHVALSGDVAYNTEACAGTFVPFPAPSLGIIEAYDPNPASGAILNNGVRVGPRRITNESTEDKIITFKDDHLLTLYLGPGQYWEFTFSYDPAEVRVATDKPLPPRRRSWPVRVWHRLCILFNVVINRQK